MNITNKTQIRNFIKTYAIRHAQGARFTIHDIYMHLPSYNKIQLQWDLEDACISGDLVKCSSIHYAGKDDRTLKEKIMSLFGNDTVTYSEAEIERYFKVRSQDVKDAIRELKAEGKLEQNPFLGMNLWLKLDSEASN